MEGGWKEIIVERFESISDKITLKLKVEPH